MKNLELRFNDWNKSLCISKGHGAFIGDESGNGDRKAIYREWSTQTDPFPEVRDLMLTPEIEAGLMQIQAEAEELYTRAERLLMS